MRAQHPRRGVREVTGIIAACLLAGAVVACGSSDAASVTVTKNMAAPAAPASSSVAPTTRSAPHSSVSKTTAVSTTTTVKKTTAASKTVVKKTTVSSKKTTSSVRSTGRSSPTANDPDVSRNLPGPEGSTKCATNSSYYDEAPTGLRPDVSTAWHNVEKGANADGIIVCLNDGKRSVAQQQHQYDEYVKDYGTAVADELVLKPDKSAHVVGIAIDVQPAAAYQWLQATKGSYGFCRIYDNEAWHFEYDVKYFTHGCPPRQAHPQH